MTDKASSIDEHLPLTPRVVLILWALRDKPRHGYALLDAVEELAQGRVSIGPASLYEAIHTLQERGWVDEAEPPTGKIDRRRRYLRLTRLGDEVLRAEARRLAGLVEDLRDAGLVEGAE